MDHGVKQSRSKPRYTKSKRNTNKLVRVKTGTGVKSKLKQTLSKEKDPKIPTTNNPEVMANYTGTINESATDRLKEYLPQDAMQAITAGGSRPMHQGTSSQIDPTTGLPIVPGGQMNINPAFGGAMANSGIPNFNAGMTMGAIAQARKEMSRDEKKAQIMSRDLPDEVKQNMIDGINQEANTAKVDGTLVNKIGEAAAKAAPLAINMKIAEKLIVPDTTYKIGNKGPRKSMVVKRNK
tara:strand:- start:533 stop:1243 length:711 start_codon:yes stop_codon:yes gene_type:complete